jgi:UDPglucose--hexose-1-phosphate uridylyltransferase
MADFSLLENPSSQKWVIIAPRRAKRPDVSSGVEPVCPFCPGKEKDEKELFRIGGEEGDSNWKVRVVPNKFPFAPIHEVVIHSPDHHKNFGELPLYQVELIFKTYKNRFIAHQNDGQVYIFHNRGEAGGESLPHPHTQIAVLPKEVNMDIAKFDSRIGMKSEPALDASMQKKNVEDLIMVETPHFNLCCPPTSQWPDEVWIIPKKRGKAFSHVTDGEIADLAFTVSRLIQIYDIRHGNEFPFNFYIYPGDDWYFRLIPRIKKLGGFEIGTGIFVNTQDPKETTAFLKEHFEKPNHEKIKTHHQAEYGKSV